MSSYWFSPWQKGYPGDDIHDSYQRFTLNGEDEQYMVEVYTDLDDWFANDGKGPFKSKEEAMTFVDDGLVKGGHRLLTQEEWYKLVVLV